MFVFEIPATSTLNLVANHNATVKNNDSRLVNLLLRTLFVVLDMDKHAGKVNVDYRLISCEFEAGNSKFKIKTNITFLSFLSEGILDLLLKLA